MNIQAASANLVWLAGGLTAVRRFHHALSDPQAAQQKWLRAALDRHSRSEYGQRHDFASIGNAKEFARRLPIVRYEDIATDVARITQGDENVLAVGRVSHLAPTSGSTGGQKLIPFTSDLTESFNAAVLPWLWDLVRQRPGIMGGPAYWSISPPVAVDGRDTRVPIGFADDADYLGGARAWLVRKALAVPSSVRHVTDTPAFWQLTLDALLLRRDLRMISIWHPSFLELLVAIAAESWTELLDAMAARDPGRAAELHRTGYENWPAWWPELQLVSCWGEQAAEPGWVALRKRLPHVLVQPKGLLATECAVTIPLGADHVLAVTSHYFEFLDAHGEVRQCHELVRGDRYEVVVTNGGGLWRYRLGDVVECTGFKASSPMLRFLGRAGRVSDLRGEKLDEVFVSEVLRSLWTDADRPAWAALRPRAGAGSFGYDLLTSGVSRDDPGLTERAERALSANPHYALARRLGQLTPVQVLVVNDSAELDRLRAWHGRIGDAKPRVLLDSGPATAS